MPGKEAKIGLKEWSALLARYRKKTRGLRTENDQYNDFYSEIAAEMNFVDPDYVKRFYDALVKVSVRTLRKNRFLRLPDFGDAYLIPSGKKTIYNPQVANKKVVLNKYFQMRFRPCNRLRDYFKKISDSLPD